MAWLVLVVAGLFEAGWAISLKQSEGFTKLVPSLVFVVSAAVSLGGLAWALKQLPVGTAYETGRVSVAPSAIADVT